MAPVYGQHITDTDSGSDSGSESEANESSASVSSSDESVKNKRPNSNQGSGRSKSRSPSPANSTGSVGSTHKTRRHSGSSNSIERRSESLDRNAGDQFESHEEAKSVRSNASGSGSPSPASQKSGSASPERDAGSQRSRSESPGNKSNASAKNSDRSRSPSVDSQSGQVNMKKIPRSPRSPASPRSPKSPRSPRTPASPRSPPYQSPSEGSNASRQSSGRSRSPSPESDSDKKSRKRSPSPMSNTSEHKQNDAPSSRENSRPGSRSSHRSRSSSKNRSDSEAHSNRGSPRKSPSPEARSRSNSPAKSRSGSPRSDIEGQKSRQSKSPDSSQEDKDADSTSKKGAHGRDAEHGQSGESDSDTEVKESSKKRKRALVSDESGSDADANKKKARDDQKDDGEDSGDKELVIDAEALFGNASDISSEDERKAERNRKAKEEHAEPEQERDEEDEEDEKSKADGINEVDDTERDEDKENEPEDQQLETRIDVEVPKITMNLGKELHFIKLPNFLSVETRPFDKASYEDEIDEEETLDEEGRARLKLKVENTIRWREVAGKDDKLVKQSNARFVRWSDGSMSLHLGSEIFDVYKQSLHGDHNHLFIRQGTGLQGQAVFRTKLTFRPHSTESFTHRKMTMSLADRSQKTTGIKVLSLVGKDPEAHRGELIKKEEERLRASVRRASKQKRIREKAANRGLSANYLEPDRYNDLDSDDEVISINAIKKQHQNKLANRKGDRPHIYSSDEEGSDIETRRARRLDKAKALKDSESDEGSGEDGAATRGRSSSKED